MELDVSTFGPTSGGGSSGVVVDRDAELQPLPDDEEVPDTARQPPAANDTIQDDALGEFALVPDPSADEQAAASTTETPVRSRLPMTALLGLLGVVVLAAVAATAWSLRRG